MTTLPGIVKFQPRCSTRGLSSDRIFRNPRLAAAAGAAAGLRRVRRGLGQRRRQRQLLHAVRAGHLRGDPAQPGLRAVPGGDLRQQLGLLPLPQLRAR